MDVCQKTLYFLCSLPGILSFFVPNKGFFVLTNCTKIVLVFRLPGTWKVEWENVSGRADVVSGLRSPLSGSLHFTLRNGKPRKREGGGKWENVKKEVGTCNKISGSSSKSLSLRTPSPPLLHY